MTVGICFWPKMSSAAAKKGAQKLQKFLKDKTPNVKRFKALVGYTGTK